MPKIICTALARHPRAAQPSDYPLHSNLPADLPTLATLFAIFAVASLYLIGLLVDQCVFSLSQFGALEIARSLGGL